MNNFSLSTTTSMRTCLGGNSLSAFLLFDPEAQRVVTCLKIVGKKKDGSCFHELAINSKILDGVSLIALCKLSSTSNVKSYRLPKEQLVEVATTTRSGQRRLTLIITSLTILRSLPTCPMKPATEALISALERKLVQPEELSDKSDNAPAKRKIKYHCASCNSSVVGGSQDLQFSVCIVRNHLKKQRNSEKLLYFVTASLLTEETWLGAIFSVMHLVGQSN